MTVRQRYHAYPEPHVIIIDLEFDAKEDTLNKSVTLQIRHVANREVALFLYGRRGYGPVDPQIIDDINYARILFIPRYMSFETGDRIGEIRVTSTFNPATMGHNRWINIIQELKASAKSLPIIIII